MSSDAQPLMSSGFNLQSDHDLAGFLRRSPVWTRGVWAGPQVGAVTARRLGFCPVKGSSVPPRAADNIDIHAFHPHGGAGGASSLTRRSSRRPWSQVKREDALVSLMTCRWGHVKQAKVHVHVQPCFPALLWVSWGQEMGARCGYRA